MIIQATLCLLNTYALLTFPVLIFPLFKPKVHTCTLKMAEVLTSASSQAACVLPYPSLTILHLFT
jgi:hypothetical protein